MEQSNEPLKEYRRFDKINEEVVLHDIKGRESRREERWYLQDNEQLPLGLWALDNDDENLAKDDEAWLLKILEFFQGCIGFSDRTYVDIWERNKKKKALYESCKFLKIIKEAR